MSYPRPTSPPPTATLRDTMQRAAVLMGGLLALMWILEAIDQASGNALDAYGVRSWDVSSLPLILTSGFLHFGWDHLMANSLPFLVLGFIIRVTAGLAKWLVTTLLSVVGSGLFAWLLSPINTITAGASGIIFGWLVYLLLRGFFSKDWKQILLAIGVFMIYGGVLWGVLPGNAGISWQAHLGGAIGGALAAWLMHARSPRQPVSASAGY